MLQNLTSMPQNSSKDTKVQIIVLNDSTDTFNLKIKLWYHYFLRNNYGIKVLYSCLCNRFPRLWYSISSFRVLPVNSKKLLSTWWNQAQYSLILVKYVRSSRARFLMHNPRHENINIYIFSMFIIRSCRLKFTYNWPIWKQVLMWIVHMCRRE